MKRNTIILLAMPAFFALASCGLASQLSYQQYQDGIYNYYQPSQADQVALYSVEDFESMAAANIARKQQEAKDTVYVVLDNRSSNDIDIDLAIVPFLWGSYYYSPWNLWLDPWDYSYWYRHYGRHYYRHYSWLYDPWYYGWHDPWYYHSWYYDPWYHDPWYHHHHWRPAPPRPKPGLNGDRYWGNRHFTQSPGNRNNVPGRGTGLRNPSSIASGAGSGNFGSGGAAIINPNPGGNKSNGSVQSSNGTTGSSTVRSRFSNRQSSPSVNVGGTSSSTRSSGSVSTGTNRSRSSGSTTYTRPSSGSSSGNTGVRPGTTTRERSSGTTTRSYNSGSSTRSYSSGSSSTTRSRSSYSSGSSSSSRSSFSGGSSSRSSFSGGSRSGGGGSYSGGGRRR